jgi:N-methylhydantoinase B
MKRLDRGDAITIRAGGGGGFGPPEARDPKAVAHDVRQGYVSPEVARDVYGVALDPKTLAVDPAATEKQRAELKRRKP